MASTLPRRLPRLAALGLALAAGCQTMNFATPVPPGPAAGPSADHLTGAQVADMQLALGQSLERQGSVDRARAAYTSAREKDPTRTDATLKLAALHARRGEFAEAGELYQQALAADPKNADAYCDLGYAQYLQEQWAAAEASLRKCLALQKDHTRAHNNLGLVLARERRADEALAEFERAGNGETDARLNLAYAQTLNADLGDARRQYAKVLTLDPHSEPAKAGLSRCATLAAKLGGDAPRDATADRRPAVAPRADVVPASAQIPERNRLNVSPGSPDL